jgi:hypothetical protein
LPAGFEGRTLISIQKTRHEVQVIPDDRSRHEMAEAMDKRKSERHRIGGTARFRWEDAEGAGQEQTGNLRNVSAGGVFVETSSLPPLGAEIDIEFKFDRPRETPTASITAKGHVTRVEMISLDHQVSGFAVVTGRMNLHRSGGDR